MSRRSCGGVAQWRNNIIYLIAINKSGFRKCFISRMSNCYSVLSSLLCPTTSRDKRSSETIEEEVGTTTEHSYHSILRQSSTRNLRDSSLPRLSYVSTVRWGAMGLFQNATQQSSHPWSMSSHSAYIIQVYLALETYDIWMACFVWNLTFTRRISTILWKLEGS